jgi:FAD/FMN-containing dehydrogenase
VTASETSSLATTLQQRCVGRVLDAQKDRDARATDFGGMYRVTPTLVLQPTCIADVQAALRFAGERDLRVTLRGMAHSQAGQGLGAGLLLDMTSLNRVIAVEPSRGSIEVEAGCTWRAVVDATYPQGLLPVALTYALDTTVGGTLSVGGIGSAAWSYGPQVDNVSYLDVVTPDGEVVRCSSDTQPQLFDAVRAGLGQCGVIVRVGFPLRPCKSHIETRTFVYRELGELLRDAQHLAAELEPDHLWAVRVGPDPLGQVGAIGALFIGSAAGDDARPAKAWPRLHHGFEAPARREPTWTPDGVPGHPFFRVYGAPHIASSEGQNKHPWVDVFFSLSDAPRALAALAANPNRLLYQGTSELIFVRRGSTPAPLLITPPEQLVVGLGMFSVFQCDEAQRAAAVMESYEREMLSRGGKRYLSGYFGAPRGPSDWAEHYGAAWPAFCAAKSLYDPALRFESRLIRWTRDLSG